MSVESWSEAPSEGTSTKGQTLRAASVRPRLGVADVFLQLWRAKLLMFLIFMAFLVAGLAATMLFPTKYTATTRVLVTLGQEYVFDPVVGDAAKGAYFQQEEMLSAERDLATSPVIAERVIERVGLERLFPKLAEARDKAKADGQYAVSQQALEGFARRLGVSTRPKSSILGLSLSHVDGALAAETLNVFVDAYMKYRQEILSGRAGAGVTAQRGRLEERVQAADAALRSFLEAADVSDLDAENEAVVGLYSVLTQSLTETEASLSEAEGRVQSLSRQLQSTPPEIDLYVESVSEQELASLRVQRQALLARYRPESQMVADIDRQIAQLEEYSTRSKPSGLRRVGPNPTYQSLEADLATARAEVVAIQRRSVELVRQKQIAEDRRKQLALLQPEYRRLVRERDALNSAADSFAMREQADFAQAEMESAKAGSISVYEPARPPRKGSSPKRAIAAGAAFLGLLSALAAGLLRAWSQRGLSTAGSLERTLGLPVLASVTEKRRR